MALNDVYEVTLQQEQRGQDVSNVFHLHQVLEFLPVLKTHAQVLAENFVEQVLPLINSWQIAEVVTTGVRARNLFNVSDDFTVELATPGSAANTGQSLPQFSAVAFALNGDNPAVKNGAKRFAGLTEDVQDDGVITNTTFIAQMTNLADKLEGYVTVGEVIQDNAFKFVIVKRIRSGSPGNYTYRLPANALESTLSGVVVAVFKALITSQVSRKIGVGA